MPRWWNKLKGFMGRRRYRVKGWVLRHFSSPRPSVVVPHSSAVTRAFEVPIQRYRLEESRGWRYEERHPQPTGYRHFVAAVSPLPHLVLRDNLGVPRFTLSYRKKDGDIQLEEIQRSHTVEWLPDESLPHHARRETLASNAFRATLNGVYPPEFLLIHFLRAHRREILKGKKLTWQWTVYADDYLHANNAPNALYPPLARRYFRQVRIPNLSRRGSDISYWELDLEKPRTREALKLKPLKKKK